ncbi:BamA/TamA family outer membrane protein [Flavobacterium sandaracinum]|uniref:Uncharacterized protein n=1 Tax=Flavobacterium sandaracinum TaxID=2541733 RepID=A0A4R5CVF8_9FLAO|nr:BamA/TamA family outer membrane protein [Flavobacterium sandaracinum]TDE04702.1 hypothetical protein E0F91_07335 [Flavobacterium sandaracinum]
MKRFLIFLLFLIFGWHSSAQNFQLKIIGQSDSESKTIDSLGYNSKHQNTKELQEEINKFSIRLIKIGYIDNNMLEFSKAKDSSFIAKINIGEKVKSISIYLGDAKQLNNLITRSKKNDSIEVPYSEIDLFLEQTLQKLEQNGFSLAKLKLVNITRDKSALSATLQVETDQKRILNSITIRYAENGRANKFPKGHLTQINKKYQKIIFNQKVVEQINTDFEKYNFVNQLKYPEILFTKDSTKVYVYLEKRNSNTFDGFLGFANNDNQKIILTGYLDINLQNILGSGEQLSIYWKSDGNDQKTFKASLELPYLFQTPIGLKAQLQVFRQDTTFQNTKTAIDLSYFINYNSRMYLGYHTTESSDIQNSNSTSISDFNNSFLTSSFEYLKSDTNNNLFPIKSKFQTAVGIGKRKITNPTEDSKNNQLTLTVQAMHNIYLNKKNSIHLNSQNSYLNSNRYVVNELFRFGGFNSIRGFAENSLQAYLTTSLLTEYRYVLAPNLYLNTILDYGLAKNKSGSGNSDITENLIGIGLGMGLQTKNGLLKVALANGKTKKQQFEIYNSIIHISYNVKF